MQDKYDPVLLGILQNEGEIVKFLDVLFSFLYRRTDFYMQLTLPTDKLGFKPGIAKKLVLSAFKKYETLAAELEKTQKSVKEKEIPKSVAVASAPVPMEVPEAVATEEVVSTDTSNATPLETFPKAAPDAIQLIPNEQKDYSSLGDIQERADVHEKSDDLTPIKDGVSCAASNIQEKGNPDDDIDPELTRMQKVFQAHPESYNGAMRDNYSWAQSITDVDVRVHVPKHICKGKDVKVEIAKKHLKVSYKDAEGHMVEAVDGGLVWDVNKDDSIWSLVPGEHIHVNLEKVEERWWDALLVNEPKISVRKIDPSRPMTDLDDEAQAKIEELMYNEQQKRLGLPQSHEKKVHEMLHKAWDAEGSPFKGQPFDPSKINISPSS